MTTSTKSVHEIFEWFLAKLAVVSREGDKATCYCPVHEPDGAAAGHNASLSVSIGDKGVILHCFAGCLPASVAHATGTRFSELFIRDDRGPGGRRKRPRGKKVAEYDYRDAEGVLLFQTVRMEHDDGSKDFVGRRPNGEGGWLWSLKGVQRVLYRLPELVASAADKAQPVFVPEGEKKVDAVREWGLTATCNAFGSQKKWTKENAACLNGRHVVILPDNDEPGLQHALDVAEILRGIAASIKIVNLPDLPPKGDVCDWKAAGGTKQQFLEIVERATGESVDVAKVAAEQDQEKKRESDPLNIEHPDFRNDIGNGKRLIKAHGQDLRFCHPWDKWLIWDGRRWKIDDTAEAYRRAKSIPVELRKQLRTMAGNISETMYAKIAAFVDRSSTIGHIDRLLQSASSEPGCQVLPNELDARPWYLNCQNGTVDLRTGQMHMHDRGDLLTKISPTAFDPEATCQTWERLVLSLFGGDAAMVSYVQRLCGYWATGIVREQILPILHGSGANGKTTFLNAIMEVLGQDFAIKGAAEFLMAKRNDVHPTEKADLFGRRLVVCSETQEGRRLAESLVKELTGTERVRARRMREDFWEFEPTHKIVLCTNHKPIISGTDLGIWRRMRLIPFTVKFWDEETGESGPEWLKQDKNLPTTIREEYPGILTWIVKGCLEWLHDGEGLPQPIREETAQYKASQDVIGSFLESCCVTGEYFSINATELYSAYKAWCELNGEFFVNQRRFGMSMTERGHEKHRSNGILYRKITLVGKK